MELFILGNDDVWKQVHPSPHCFFRRSIPLIHALSWCTTDLNKLELATIDISIIFKYDEC